VRPGIQERTDEGRSMVGRNGHRQRRSPTSVRAAAVSIDQQTRRARHGFTLGAVCRRADDGHLAAHQRAYASGPVDESPADLVTPGGNAPDFHHDRVGRFVAIELNATAATDGAIGNGTTDG
jgi:hypothetical protein